VTHILGSKTNQATLLVFRQKSTHPNTFISGDVTWYSVGMFLSRYHHRT